MVREVTVQRVFEVGPRLIALMGEGLSRSAAAEQSGVSRKLVELWMKREGVLFEGLRLAVAGAEAANERARVQRLAGRRALRSNPSAFDANEIVRCVKADCLQWKPRSEFHQDPRKANGRGSWCKECCRRYGKSWSEQNKDRLQERRQGRIENDNAAARDRYRFNPEMRARKAAAQKQRYAEAPEAFSARTKDWYRRNAERVAEYGREWRAQNKERHLATARARHQRRAASGFEAIYFIAEGAEFVKIGYTKQPVSMRLDELQIGNPRALTVIACMSGTRLDEQALHDRFAHLRVRGEWFRLDRSILDFIGDHGPNSSELPAPQVSAAVSSNAG